MKQFLKNNLAYLFHFILSILLELSTVAILTGMFAIRKPWILLFNALSLFFIFNLISNKKAKLITISSVFGLQLIINLFCVILYENTGTLFDFSMIQLAGESTMFLSTITINYWYIAYVILLFIVYLLVLSIFSKYIDSSFEFSFQKFACSLLLIGTIISQITVVHFDNRIQEKSFVNSLYKDANEKYINYGGSGSFINELIKFAFYNNYNKLSDSEIEEFIYSEVSSPSSKFGVSQGNNLVTILVESFEWFGLVSDKNAYPNGMDISDEILDELFPNLREFYSDSIVMNNHYSQNKTDISEDESLLGSYPSSAYISYIFPNNTLPTSTPNVLKQEDEKLQTNFFHANMKSYYNRENMVTSLGFDNLYFIEKMEEKGYTNYIEKYGLGEGGALNLDSEMFSLMKDEMFPSNERFYTHITTISMHGNYIYRHNMQKRLDKMESLGVEIKDEELRNYVAAVMDFDEAVGIMMSDLETKGLLDTTTILMYSDHNTYMSNLTYDTKDIGITEYDDNNYIELYRLPFMLYDSNFKHQIVNKFTTTQDIVPTILDLFGINYYTNMYFGNSIFSKEESVLYSKAFDIFIADGLYYRNINNILYKREGVSQDDIDVAEEKSLKLLKKIYYTNNIFESNYFKNTNNYNKYITKFNYIN